MKYKNTLQKGSVRYLIFKDGDTFFGVALEFNIVVDGVHPAEVFLLLNEAVQGYIEAARKIKLRPHVLNQKADPEYERMWQVYWDRKLKERYERIVNRLPIFNAGRMELAQS